jgi:hypothetical protein
LMMLPKRAKPMIKRINPAMIVQMARFSAPYLT